MPSVALFLLRFFLSVLLLLPSVFLFCFLSEALEFSDGDSCVVSVTAFAVFILILPDLHLVRHCSCLFLVAFCLCWFVSGLLGQVACDCVCECWCFLVSRVLLRVF